MKILAVILILAFGGTMSYAKIERDLDTQPELKSAAIVDSSEGQATIEAKLSSPALIVDSVPAVVFYRPVLRGITIITPGVHSRVRHIFLQEWGRGFRAPDAEIALHDKTSKKIGSMTVDRKDYTKVVFKVPSEWIAEGGVVVLGIVHAIELQTKTEQAVPPNGP